MICIAAVGYNRPDSIKRLLLSLAIADYAGDEVDLVISIDKGEKQNLIIEVANEFQWSYGKKIIRAYPERQGLRKHILQCGDLTEKYDAVIILEDDLVVSKAFYKYVKATIEKYGDDERISGISLYSYAVNEFANCSFSPVSNGFDVYAMQVAQSWGQCWTKSMWQGFRSWEHSNDEELIEDCYMPSIIFHWGKTSWKKNYMAYNALNNKYFIYPYFSFSTNFSESGEHINVQNADAQVALVEDQNEWRLCEFDECIKYDIFFERIFEDKRFEHVFQDKKICIDLYGLKKDYGNAQILFSSKCLPYKIIDEVGLTLRPQEENCIYMEKGNGIYVYDLTISATSPRKDTKYWWYEYRYINANFRFSLKYGIYGFYRAICRKFGANHSMKSGNQKE